MKVLHVNSSTRGGAANAMMRLHRGLLRQGAESHICVGHRRKDDDENVLALGEQCFPFAGLSERIIGKIGRTLESYIGVNRFAYPHLRHFVRTDEFKTADVILLRNLHGKYFDLWSLPVWSRNKPVVWRLPDMWAITGHCCYSYDCSRWRTGCYRCPLLRGEWRKRVEPEPTVFDHTARIWHAKRDIYQRSRLHIVTPSHWLQKCVEESILKGVVSVAHIPNGVDVSVFHPWEKQEARRTLGLPREGFLIGFSAQAFDIYRKGIHILTDAVTLMNPPPDGILIMGGSRVPDQLSHATRTFAFGYVNDETKQSLIYSAADVYVVPSLADNSPQVAIEAMACGTPVIAFNVTGVPELVRHMSTGLLVKPGDAGTLAAAMVRLRYDTELRKGLADQARTIAEQEYTSEIEVSRYLELFHRAAA